MERAGEAWAGGVRRVVHDSIDSTNAEAWRLVRAGETGPLWIVAREQTAGRGRRGRDWASPQGNLYATLLLTDPCAPPQAPQLSFVAALALHDAVANAAPAVRPELQVKWPNDLVLGGAKVAGILVEGESAAAQRFTAAIGIGVNCANRPEGTPYPASDLRTSGAHVAPDALFEALASAMRVRLDQWARGAAFEVIRADWTARAARLNEVIRLQIGDETVEGNFDGIDGSGRLVMTMEDGSRRSFNAGDVVAGMATLDRLRTGAAL